jgi:hypothetical protein
MGDARFINCEACQTEGRVLTNDGGPDDVDHGVCPVCGGARVVEIETQSITLDDLPPARGGPTEKYPDRPYCKSDQSCCDFCCGN